MADDVDRATLGIEAATADAIRRARGGLKLDPRFDGVNCLVCDEPIHPQRLKHGFQHCVDCKTLMERKR